MAGGIVSTERLKEARALRQEVKGMWWEYGW